MEGLVVLLKCCRDTFSGEESHKGKKTECFVNPRRHNAILGLIEAVIDK